MTDLIIPILAIAFVATIIYIIRLKAEINDLSNDKKENEHKYQSEYESLRNRILGHYFEDVGIPLENGKLILEIISLNERMIKLPSLDSKVEIDRGRLKIAFKFFPTQFEDLNVHHFESEFPIQSKLWIEDGYRIKNAITNIVEYIEDVVEM